MIRLGKRLGAWFAAMLIFVLLPETAMAASFRDVSDKHWAHEAIENLVAEGILKGYPDGTFQPNKAVMRSELAAILARTGKLTASDVNEPSFADVSRSKWYFEDVTAASPFLGGYVIKGQSVFLPDQLATREETFVAIARLLGYDDTYDIAELMRFKDWTSISATARPLVARLVAEGIANGLPDQTFGPGKSVTRAEVAALIRRCYSRLQSNQPQDDDSATIFSGNWRSPALSETQFTIIITDSEHGYIVYESDGISYSGSFRYMLQAPNQMRLILLDDPDGPAITMSLIASEVMLIQSGDEIFEVTRT